MTEEWRAVEGYEGRYEISSFGRLRGTGRRKNKTWKLLSPRKTTRGYEKVSFCRNGTPKEFLVHRVVAKAFMGESDLEVMHLDGDKLNNRVSNLRYGSKTCNEAFKIDHGTAPRGERCGTSKLTEKDVFEIRQISKIMTHKEIGRIYGVGTSHVSSIVRRVYWAFTQQ